MAEQTVVFKEGDPIVHPNHGAGRIVSIKTWEINGVTRQYYNIELMNDHGMLMIPIEQAEEAGLRRATVDSERLTAVLNSEPNELDGDHRKRQADIAERIHSGDAELVTEALRDLAWREHTGNLTERDQKLKAEAEALVIGELALQPDLDLDSATHHLHEQLREALDARQPAEDEE